MVAPRGDISFGCAPQTALSLRPRGRREAVNGEPPHRTETAVAPGEGFSAYRVHHHLDAFRDRAANDVHKILACVIDGMVDADLAKKSLLGRAGCAEHCQVVRFRELHRGAPYPAGDTVDKNAVAWLQIAHDKHGVVRGEVVHGNCCGLLKGDSLREPKDAFCWRSNSLGVTGELGESHNALADLERPVTRRTCRHPLDHSGHLESGDECPCVASDPQNPHPRRGREPAPRRIWASARATRESRRLRADRTAL